MLTEHTERLGAFEVTRDRYLQLLKAAVGKPGVRF
jgi:Leu/Phe-tRNA-protein transferase